MRLKVQAVKIGLCLTPPGTETTVEQKLEVLRELLLDVSRAMLDIRMGVQRLYERSRQGPSTDAGRAPADLR